MASAHGKRVVSLNFPLMFPPPEVDGYVVPGGWMPWRQLRLGCHPPGLFDRLKTLPSFEPKELALDMKLEAKAIDGCAEEEYAEWIQLHTRREQRWFEILRYLLSEDDSVDLVAVMFDGPDKLQHLCWRFIDPALRPQDPTPWEAEILELCDGYFRSLDALLADIVELAGPDPTVVVASDHGFGPTQDLFYVNAWLEQHGYLAWADDRRGRTGAGSADRVQPDDAARLRARLDEDGRLCGDPEQPGDPPRAARRRHARRAGLRGAGGRDRCRACASSGIPTTDSRSSRDVKLRQDAFAGPYEALAPDLTLELADGAAVSILNSDELVRRLDEPYGNHRPEGIFLATGPVASFGSAHRRPVHPRRRAAAPLQPRRARSARHVGSDSRGGVRAGRARSRGLPVSSQATRRRGSDGRRDDVEYDADEQETILSRLRALGYVE